MGRYRAIVLATVLVSIGVGFAVARAQVSSSGATGASPDAGLAAAASASAPWTDDVPRATVLLSRLHHAAAREVLLGDLAEARATHPETRRYGADLATQFRAYDQRLVAFAARVGIDSSRLAQIYTGENVAALRRESDDVTHFANSAGEQFDRGFWVAVAQEQAAANDMLPAVTQGGPDLTRLAAELGQLLDKSSLRALYIARAQLPAQKSNQVSQPAQTR
jgi:hypothetical protein